MNVMLVMIAICFVAMKCAVLAMSHAHLTPSRTIAFFFWPGMRPSTFAERRVRAGRIAGPTRNGLACFAAGAVLFALARRLAMPFAFVVALPALSLMLHFGIIAIVTACWRAAGFDAEDLFRAPWRSRSLGEFWSRRWNVGFSDMLTVTVARPIASRFGRNAAIAASFLASGLLHELAISVPAHGGYGLPTLYFALHGALVAAGVRGRFATLAALIIPLPLCFHAAFLRTVIAPML